MKKELVALVPVREGSQRVKGKNFIDFVDGKSLLEIKVQQLKDANCFEHIYISSDSEKAKEIAENLGVEFLLRDTDACQADMIWAEVVKKIMNTIPRNPIVVWALITSPTFTRFRDVVDTYIENEAQNDSLVAVLPKKSFFLNKYGKGINYNMGFWHPYSQELETYYEVTGACYIGQKSDIIKWHYWFGPKPYLFELNITESIDVDTEEDFKFAQKIYWIINH